MTKLICGKYSKTSRSVLEDILEDIFKVSKLHQVCLDTLKQASRSNKYNLRFSVQCVCLIRSQRSKMKIQWLSQHLFCLGLDKVLNNACLLCMHSTYIQLQALEREWE